MNSPQKTSSRNEEMDEMEKIKEKLAKNSKSPLKSYRPLSYSLNMEIYMDKP